MHYALPLWEAPSIAIANSESRFPVHRIYCVGRNYAEHAREMGADPEREPPFFFCKPPDAVVTSGSRIPYPLATQNLHHEVELVVALQSGGVHIEPEAALDLVFGYAVGVDLTRRDLQQALREKGRPWDVGKAFDRAAPIGALMPALAGGHPSKSAIGLKVNGEVKQNGDVSDMIWNVPHIIAHLSELFELKAGDLIFTGTPAGVGPIQPGDLIEASITGLPALHFTVV
ncbi:MAG: fumarylacetoacetate hydrolase family protein [Pseudomonadota bacterium]|nr:fumarylacetoacetate hydrolase family protein [Pseudomonadota bacterium]